MSYATDTRSTYRLTPAQVAALDTLSGVEAGEVNREWITSFMSYRTFRSLVQRGLVNADGTLTGEGTDVLYAYI